MMTVCKCQALVVAERWLNPRVKLMAVIVASGFNRPASCTGCVERLAPLEGFDGGGPDADGKSDK
jgi:hypothetical protein